VKVKVPFISSPTLLRIAAVSTLCALALMVWSLFQPTPLPLMVAMSVGQVFGTMAFAAFGFVVLRDVLHLRKERLAREQEKLDGPKES
jgi:uncharacterized membrane protein YccC